MSAHCTVQRFGAFFQEMAAITGIIMALDANTGMAQQIALISTVFK